MMASLTNTTFQTRFLTGFKEEDTLNAICQEIALEIQSGYTQLHTVVEELEPFIIEKNASTREKSICALSIILSSLPKDFLNETELDLITSFYCNRLTQDHHSIIPTVLKGILGIVQMNNLPKNSPERLLRVLFKNVLCQHQLLPDRHNIYLIFATLLENKIEDLKAMGPDFTYGFINAISGERNPKNLMLLFTILPCFMKKFLLSHFIEEMFEAVACYFPVEYNPSTIEALRITRDDLAEKLASCLCAVTEFAEFCIPLIIDKLSSMVKVAQMDSLNLLCKGAQTFGVSGLKPYLTELWSVLKKGIIPGGDLELRIASLEAVRSIIEVISSDAKLSESFIESMLTDAKLSLFDVQLSLFTPSVNLLKFVAVINKESCIQVLQVIVPLCLGQYCSRTSVTEKAILIETLNSFIEIVSAYGFNIMGIPELTWVDISQLYLDELNIEITTQNIELQSKILFGLTLQKTYLNEIRRALLYEKICNLIETNYDEIRTLCYSSLLSFATLYPCEISTLIKERFQLNIGGEKTEIQIRKLEVLAAVAKTHKFGIEILPQIVSQISSVNSEISFTTLRYLHKLVATKHIDYDIHHYLYNECNIIEKLLAIYIHPIDQRLDIILNICRLIIRNLTFEEQQNVVNKYAAILSTRISETSAILIMNIFIPLRQNVDLAINSNILQNLYNLTLNSNHLNIRLITCKFIAVVLNKLNDNNEDFKNILLFFKEKLKNNLDSDIDIEIKRATASLQIWLTKAIIMKGSYDTEMFLDELINILKHDQIGQQIAQELTNKNEDTLVEENFCNVKIFYKQRVLEYFIKKNYEFESTSRENYLIALVQLLEEASVELLHMHLTKLVPLLIESLSFNNEQLIFSTLITLNPLLETKHVIFSDKVQSFIPRFLELSTYNTMRVRIAALNCLTSYCNYSEILINPYRQDVLEKLAVSIDDRKRLVRKVAVKARTRWFLVGMPGGI